MATPGNKYLLPAARFPVFFILFYLYVWLRIDPGLFYHAQGMLYHGPGSIPFPVFYRGTEFFREFLAYPGGLTEYFSAFLYQSFYFPPLGSLVITAAAVLISLATGRIISAMGETRFRAIIFIPVLLLLIAYNRYFLCLTAGLGLLASLFFLWIYILTARLSATFRVVVFLLSSVVLYYAAGGAYLLYALLCGILECRAGRKPLIALSYILFALIFPYAAGVLIFKIGITDTYARILPFHPESYSRASAAAWALYIFFPLAALWLSLRRSLAAALSRSRLTTSPAGTDKGKTSAESSSSGDYGLNKRSFLYESLALLLISGCVLLLPFDRHLKTSLRINYFARNEMWPQVLEQARRLPGEKYDLLINHDVNSALYHTGRLAYDMFSYPQNPKALFTLNFGFGSTDNVFSNAELPRISDTFFRLGLVNVAELSAYVALELMENPAVLRRLYSVNIAKGHAEAARVYLCALKKDLIFKEWAQRRLRRLDEDPLMSGDSEVQSVRALMPVKDHVESFTFEDLLLDLLHKNKQNRMAFEYLMAYYLFSYQFDKIIRNIHRLDDFGYTEIPTLYEEAIGLHISQTGERVLDLHGRQISNETVQRFSRFSHLAGLYSRNDPAAYDQLVEEFGNSYFFYCLFGYSGMTK